MHVMKSALVVMLLLAAPALAQGPAGYTIPGARPPRDPLPRFTIAPLGLPLPPIGLQPAPNAPFAPLAPLAPLAPFAPFAPVVAWPMMFYVGQPVAVPAPPPERAPNPVEPPLPGRLILDVAPSTAQIFADGYYVGVPDDFSGNRGGGSLEAGVHRIDVTAAGYESIAVDLKVASGQAVTYRATLKVLPPPVPAPPSTFYLIPGCYMGNIAPKDAHLPATCDVSRAIIWRP